MLSTILSIVSLIAFIPQGTDENIKSSPSKPPTPADQYAALVKEHAEVSRKERLRFRGDQLQMLREAQSRNLNDPEEIKQELAKVLQHRGKVTNFTPRFMEFAEKHPKEAEAFDALVWIVANGAPEKECDKALDILVRDHLQNEKLGPVCLEFGRADPRPGKVKLLRAVLEKSPERNLQGQACYALAMYLKLQAPGRKNEDALKENAVKFFERVAKEYADVEGSRDKTLGDLADRELFELLQLAIGKVAPNIEGEDADGKAMQLADYRGKVVVLDFWGHW